MESKIHTDGDPKTEMGTVSSQADLHRPWGILMPFHGKQGAEPNTHSTGSTGPRTQTQQQLVPRCQRLAAKATTRQGSPGLLSTSYSCPAWPPSTYPIPMALSYPKDKL